MTEDQKYLDIRTEFFKLAEDTANGYIISLYKIYEWLELELTDDIRYKLTQRCLKGDNGFIKAENEDDLNGHFIIRKDGKKSIPWFSCDGFKMITLLVKSDKAKYILRHFIQCEKDYLRALRQSKEENDKELENLREKCTKFDSILTKVVDERNELEFQANILRRENKKYHDIDRLMSDEDNYSASVFPDKIIAEFCVDHHWKKVCLYVVDPAYVNKSTVKKTKKIKRIKDDINDSSESCSDDETGFIQPEKIFPEISLDELTEHDIKSIYSAEEFYFTLKSKEVKENNNEKYKKVCDISVIDKKHMDYIKDWFVGQEDSRTRFKNIFIASYDNIQSVCNKYVANKSFAKYRLI